jgi:hypothetical protein
MKNKELIALLSAEDPEADVILQKDPEGNGYAPVNGAEPAIYDAEESIVYNLKWSAADADKEEDEWQELLKKPRCIVLWPTH